MTRSAPGCTSDATGRSTYCSESCRKRTSRIRRTESDSSGVSLRCALCRVELRQPAVFCGFCEPRETEDDRRGRAEVMA